MVNEVNSSKILTFEPSGYLNAANADELKQELISAINSEEYSVLLVNMNKVEFLDFTALMAIVAAWRLAQTLGRRLIICSLVPSVRMIFELTQLDKVLEIFDHQEFALY